MRIVALVALGFFCGVTGDDARILLAAGAMAALGLRPVRAALAGDAGNATLAAEAAVFLVVLGGIIGGITAYGLDWAGPWSKPTAGTSPVEPAPGP